MSPTKAPPRKPRMNRRVKRLWIDALLSGQYAQTKRYLRKRNGSMCCLGVLCELARADGVRVDREYAPPTTGYSGKQPARYFYDGLDGTPPDSVLDWAGIDPEAVADGPTTEFGWSTPLLEKLMDMNDNDNKSFTEIAEYIQDHTTS